MLYGIEAELATDLFRASTFFVSRLREKLVDGRDKPGHDVLGASIATVGRAYLVWSTIAVLTLP